MTVDQIKKTAVEYADLCTDKGQLKEFMIELINKVYQQGIKDGKEAKQQYNKPS